MKLHEKLVEMLGSDAVYYQPPEGTKLSYPCIVYELASGDTTFADNASYRYHDRYEVTVITRDPDEETRELVKELPMCLFDKRFVSSNLYHDVFVVYI